MNALFPKGFTFDNVRWGEFFLVILFVFGTTFLGALKTGGDVKGAAVTAVLPTYFAAVAYLRNPKAVPWITDPIVTSNDPSAAVPPPTAAADDSQKG